MKVPTEPARNVRDELLSAAVGLLDDQGPDALQTRSVAAAAATSTMMLYTQFGGMPGLIAEVAAEGRRRFDAAVTVPESDDPVADMMACGAAYRRFAIDHPHLYRLMFGSTSAHGINPPAGDLLTMSLADIRAQYAAFGQLLNYVHRCVRAGRMTAISADDDQAVVTTASQLWCMVHGFVMLELAGYFGADGAGAVSVLGAMVGNHIVAMGDSPERLMGSLAKSGWL